MSEKAIFDKKTAFPFLGGNWFCCPAGEMEALDDQGNVIIENGKPKMIVFDDKIKLRCDGNKFEVVVTPEAIEAAIEFAKLPKFKAHMERIKKARGY